MTKHLLPVGALALLILGAMLRTEGATRVQRLPFLVLRLAARRLPEEMRAGQLEEWQGNVYDVIHPATHELPLTRLGRALGFALSAWWGARKLANALDGSLPQNVLMVCVYWCWQAGLRAGAFSLRRGCPRCFGHMVACAGASLWKLPFWMLVGAFSFFHGDAASRGMRAVIFCLLCVTFHGVAQGLNAWLVERRLARRDCTNLRLFYSTEIDDLAGVFGATLPWSLANPLTWTPWGAVLFLGLSAAAVLITAVSFRLHARRGTVPTSGLKWPALTQVCPPGATAIG